MFSQMSATGDDTEAITVRLQLSDIQQLDAKLAN